jgi:hypothetical protein
VRPRHARGSRDLHDASDAPRKGNPCVSATTPTTEHSQLPSRRQHTGSRPRLSQPWQHGELRPFAGPTCRLCRVDLWWGEDRVRPGRHSEQVCQAKPKRHQRRSGPRSSTGDSPSPAGIFTGTSLIGETGFEPATARPPAGLCGQSPGQSPYPTGVSLCREACSCAQFDAPIDALCVGRATTTHVNGCI